MKIYTVKEIRDAQIMGDTKYVLAEEAIQRISELQVISTSQVEEIRSLKTYIEDLRLAILALCRLMINEKST